MPWFQEPLHRVITVEMLAILAHYENGCEENKENIGKLKDGFHFNEE